MSQIKKNYRRLVKKYHSDSEEFDSLTDKSMEFAEDRLIEIIGAYDTIESYSKKRGKARKLKICALCGRSTRREAGDTAVGQEPGVEKEASKPIRFSLRARKHWLHGLVTAIVIIGLVVVAAKYVSEPDPMSSYYEPDEHLGDFRQEPAHPGLSSRSGGDRSDDPPIDPLKALYEECLRECEDMRRAGSVNIFSTSKAMCKQRCLEGYSLLGVY